MSDDISLWTVAGRVIGAVAGASIPLLILGGLVILAGLPYILSAPKAPWNRKRKTPVR